MDSTEQSTSRSFQTNSLRDGQMPTRCLLDMLHLSAKTWKESPRHLPHPRQFASGNGSQNPKLLDYGSCVKNKTRFCH